MNTIISQPHLTRIQIRINRRASTFIFKVSFLTISGREKNWRGKLGHDLSQLVKDAGPTENKNIEISIHKLNGGRRNQPFRLNRQAIKHTLNPTLGTYIQYMEHQPAQCPACKKRIVNIKEHLTQSDCKKDVQRIYSASAKFFSGQSICFHCKMGLQTRQISRHQKSCKRSNSRKNDTDSYKSTEKQREKIRVQDDKISFVSKESFNRVDYCQSTLASRMNGRIIVWVNENLGLSDFSIIEIFDKFVSQMGELLKTAVPQIDLRRLYDVNKKIKWSEIIPKTDLLFNQKILLKRIEEKYPEKKKIILKSLNKFFKQYGLDIFESFKLDKQKNINQKSRDKRPLLPSEFLIVCRTLLETNMKGFTHLALDLMIMYQSGQRFPSSIQNMAPLINQALTNFKDESISFEIISSKTKSQQTVVLDRQLCYLLKKFEWTNFLFSFDKYSHLTRYFPFACYSLRRGYFCYIYASEMKKLNQTAIMNMTGHKNWKNVEHYVNKIVFEQKKILLRSIRFDDIEGFQYKEETALPFPSIFQDISSKIKLEDDWFNFTFNSLQKDLSHEEFIVFKHKIKFNPPQLLVALKQNQNVGSVVQVEEISDFQSNSQSDFNAQNRQLDYAIINESKFKLDENGRLNPKILVQAENQKCSQCSQNLLICKFCKSKKCFNCLSLTFCPCMKQNKKDGNKYTKGVRKSQIVLTMPEKYLGSNEQNLIEIQTLIFARGFFFTNTCVQGSDLHAKTKQQIAYLTLPLFCKYISLEYFPPLRLFAFGDDNCQGTGFGLRAQEDIESGVLIGEYAADKFFQTDERFVTRKDMLFTLTQEKDPSQNVLIGPMKYCGYVPLINCSKLSSQINCASVTAIVSQIKRIIIFTIRKIHVGEQLFYDYKEREDQKLNLESLISEPSNTSAFKNLKIQNTFNNCYLTVILQLFFMIQDKLQNLKKSYQGILNQVIKVLRKSYTNSFRLSNKFEKQFQKKYPQFKLGEHHDSGQIFIRMCTLFQQGSIELQKMLMIQQNSIKCEKCTKQTFQKQSCPIIHTEVGSNLSNIFLPRVQKVHIKCSCSFNYSEKTTIIAPTNKSEILSILIKRFLQTGLTITKDNSMTQIPQTLSYQGIYFDLYALVLHSGTINRGHYTLFAVGPSILLDGETFIYAKKIKTENIYMIFYQKRKNQSDH